MNHLIQEIDRIIEERSLLKHPFYQTWSDGKLTREALVGYSKEYYQLVKAVPIFMTQLMDHVPDGECRADVWPDAPFQEQARA